VTEPRTLDWTFQVPAAGEGAAGLEDYVVEDRAGHRVGTVTTVIRHDGETFVVVEAGLPPIDRDLHAVPWNQIAEIDDDRLAVSLVLTREELERLPKLDRSHAVEQGEAEAVRVTDVPGEPRTVPPGSVAGPVDRFAFVVPLGSGLLGVFLTLVFVLWATGDRHLTWEWALLAIPAALLLFAAVSAYRIYRQPYED
jgi:hypothetical protein